MLAMIILGDVLLVVLGNEKQKDYVLTIFNPFFVMFFTAYMIVLIFLLSLFLVYQQRKRLTNPIDSQEPLFYIGLRYALD